MKKILVINTKYRTQGGEDTNIGEEVKFLKKFYRVEVIEFSNKNKLSANDILGLFFSNITTSNNELAKKIEIFKPDFAYVHNTWFRGNLGLFNILKEKNINTVLKIHNFRYICTNTFKFKTHLNNNNSCPMRGIKYKKYKYFNKYFEDSYIKSLIVNLYGTMYLKILKNSNFKIAVLNSFHEEKMKSLGISEERIFKIYNPSKISKVSTYNPHNNYAVYAGYLSDSKGVLELINAWNRSATKIQLYIFGNGPLEKKINGNFYKNIKIFGYKNNDEILEYIKNALAVITATKMYEGQPRILCEASGYGVPSIFPRYGGMQEYFPENYDLSFEQYNYDDLVGKILKLELKENLKKISEELFTYNKALLDDQNLQNQFKKVFV